jgi:hypothetical protein
VPGVSVPHDSASAVNSGWTWLAITGTATRSIAATAAIGPMRLDMGASPALWCVLSVLRPAETTNGGRVGFRFSLLAP